MVNAGAVPVDFASPVGQVRVLMGDTDPSNVSADGTTGEYVWFSDAELAVHVMLAGGDPRRAAVAALRVVAITPALKLRKWQSADLQVDGPAITKALTDHIASIEAGIAATDAAEGYFSIDAAPRPVPIWDRPGPIGHAGPPFLVPGFLFDEVL